MKYPYMPFIIFAPVAHPQNNKIILLQGRVLGGKNGIVDMS